MNTGAVRNWGLLLALVAMWGSSFMFIKIGIATVPPVTLVAARLVLGAVILYTIMRARGLVLPPPDRRWLPYIALAILGNCLPFFLIAWGQQFIDSALAGILISIMPLATLVLAHFFIAGDRMTVHKAMGFAIGFAGIVVLMGPAALAGLGGAAGTALAQAAVLAGALCYAGNSVLARRTIAGDFLVASTAVLIAAAVLMLPVALVVDYPYAGAPTAGHMVGHRADCAGDHTLFSTDRRRGAHFHGERQLSVASCRPIGGRAAPGRAAGNHGIGWFNPDFARNFAFTPGVRPSGLKLAALSLI